MEFIFIIIIIIGILSSVGPLLFGIWAAWVAGRTVNRAVNSGMQIYNALIEGMMRQLAMELQAQHHQEASERQQAIQRELRTLPSREQRLYRQRLSDVVDRKQVLNPATGEWENG